jgi:hypothetical protein
MRSPVEVARCERTRLRRRTVAARQTELGLHPIACDRPWRVGSECGEWRVQRPLVTGWSRSGPVEVRPRQTVALSSTRTVAKGWPSSVRTKLLTVS